MQVNQVKTHNAPSPSPSEFVLAVGQNCAITKSLITSCYSLGKWTMAISHCSGCNLGVAPVSVLRTSLRHFTPCLLQVYNKMATMDKGHSLDTEFTDSEHILQTEKLRPNKVLEKT